MFEAFSSSKTESAFAAYGEFDPAYRRMVNVVSQLIFGDNDLAIATVAY